jgi:hypothetical protein
MSKLQFNDKDLQMIKDRAIHEWKQFQGEEAVARSYIYAVSIWLKEKGVLEEVPVYKSRDLAINSHIE